MVPSLVQYSTNKLLHNISSIHDTGITPVHLLLPILSRMNAKQLGHIESTSPQLTPSTDLLWHALIEKDFPTRPPPRSQKLQDDPMPNKSLYLKYVQEEESRRQDLTQRLRKITERLRRQKSANQIIKVPELLKDPTVRRRQFMRAPGGSVGSRYANPKKNSILLKARKETLSRTMMFPNLKVYDPFNEYKAAKNLVVCDPRQNPNNRTSPSPSIQTTRTKPGANKLSITSTQITSTRNTRTISPQTSIPRTSINKNTPTTINNSRTYSPSIPPRASSPTIPARVSYVPRSESPRLNNRSVRELREQPSSRISYSDYIRNEASTNGKNHDTDSGPKSSILAGQSVSPTISTAYDSNEVASIDSEVSSRSPSPAIEGTPQSPSALRKRRPPSIFLARKKPVPPPRKKRAANDNERKPQSRIKLIKSSVFQ